MATTADAHELFRYDPVLGKLFNRVTRNNRVAKAGDEAGTYDDGYRRVKLNGKKEMVHRLIWEMFKGPIPKGMTIDHINGIRDDNRLSQLRVISKAEQQKNAKLRKDSTSGHLGVHWNKRAKKWAARIARVHLGYFTSIEEAVKARKEADGKHGYHKNHGR